VFERFTDRARRVVVLAQEEARVLNHNYIGTEHILLGLIHEGNGIAARALEALGVEATTVRQQVEEIIGRSDTPPSGHIPFTPRAKKVLELSLREALALNHNYIGTEHILLGLIKEGEGVGAQVLTRLGADLERVRAQVLELLSGYAGEEPPAPRRRLFRRTPEPMISNIPGMGEVLEPELGLERLADDSLRAVLAARAEARRTGHAEVEPEHLLVGLLAVETDPGARRLAAMGVSLDALVEVLRGVAQPSQTPVPPVPPLAAATWRVLADAAGQTRAEPVDTDALLDALQAQSTAVRLALRAAGADADGGIEEGGTA
jgi:ATP-dependent Clp protease ATP-binding subunit ClpA